jgi:hypothetical protein
VYALAAIADSNKNAGKTVFNTFFIPGALLYVSSGI